VGQREAAAPMFSGLFDHLRQPENTSSRNRLAIISQVGIIRRSSRGEARISAGLLQALVAGREA
jgi:hypothetical protein